jgi:decaprenylphospho-beta-D-erythro-pentofuranosid-2-ulose 2-reductase
VIWRAVSNSWEREVENAFGQPQRIVVMAGSSDIARAITKKLCAARVHTVVLAGRDQQRLDEARTEAQAFGASQVETVLFDARDPTNAERTVTKAFAKAGGTVDLVVVAVGMLGDQERFQDDALRVAEVATVNFTWPVAALARVRGLLVAQGSGRILVLSSVAAVRVRRAKYLYGGAKAGLDRLCVGMADSLEGSGVSMHIVRPGHVRSRMTAGIKDPPFATDVNDVADDVMRGLAKRNPIIWSPSILRYVFFVLQHLPVPLWRKVTDAMDRSST